MRTFSTTVRPLLGIAALAAVTLGAVAAATAGNVISPTPTTTQMGRPVTIACKPQGGNDFPHIYVVNTTDQTLAAGRKVTYKTSSGLQGSFTLASAVSPKGGYYGPSAQPFNSCTASVMVAL